MLDPVSVYAGMTAGILIGALITSLWIDRVPKSEWLKQFEKDHAACRPQAMGCSHKGKRHAK